MIFHFLPRKKFHHQTFIFNENLRVFINVWSTKHSFQKKTIITMVQKEKGYFYEMFTRQSVKKGYFVIKSRKCFLFSSFFSSSHTFKCSFLRLFAGLFSLNHFIFSSEDISCECQCHMRVMKSKATTIAAIAEHEKKFKAALPNKK